MRFQALASALALAGTSSAFSDASPWVLLSSSSFGEEPSPLQIQTSAQALGFTKSFLQSCPTSRFLLINQPGVTATDLRGSRGCAMPSLCSAVEDARNEGKYIVSEVVGEASTEGLSDYIKRSCESKDNVYVETIDLASLSAHDRSSSLSANDVTVADELAAATADGSYTILFFSTPGEPTTYEPEFDEPVRMNMMRHDPRSILGAREAPDNRPLFEKYQFFTPGIFMGIFVALILFSILGVGIKALASLEVSYGAFEKDMGPAAQKK